MAVKKKPVAAEKPKHKPNRPKFSRELVMVVCDRLANGESLNMLSQDFEMPSTASWFRWCAGTDVKHDDAVWLREQYACARELQADYYAAEALKVAVTPMIGKTVKTVDDGETIKTEESISDNVPRSRLAYDALRWHASKLAPKKYGDKIEHSGTGTGGAIIVQMSATDAEL